MSRRPGSLAGLLLLVITSNAPLCAMGASLAADPARNDGVACAAGGLDAEECSAADQDSAILLQRSAVRHKDKQPLAVALVDEVYTYGAPATHKQPFRNAATADGCFPGLRSYTENLIGAYHEIHQVDAAAMNNYYPHAYTSSVVLHWGIDSYFTPCAAPTFGHPDWPQRGSQVYEEWSIHHERHYQDRLDEITVNRQDKAGMVSKGGTNMTMQQPFKTAREFVTFAFRSYDTVADTKRDLAMKMPDWNLVQREVYKTHNDEDPVMIIQHSQTLDCAFVFTGTNNGADLPSSTTAYGTGYCGFEEVHVGYRNELWTLTKHLWPKLRPTLEQCFRVICVGHSLGGALCEVFAACANSGNTTDADFQLLAWDKAKNPRLMPPIEG